jgi:hypothetical protein
MKLQRKFRSFAALLLPSAFLFMAVNCEREAPKPTDLNPVSTESGVALNFDSRFGTEDFTLNKVYLNKNGDSVVIGSFRYFISNVQLVKTDGSIYKVPDSYYLMENAAEKVREKVSLQNIPSGEYTKLRFMVGIDSLRNQTIDNATGDLMPTNHMTWMWHTGFIFLNIKGQYYNPATAKFDGLGYEIGKDYSSRVVELNFPAATPKVQLGDGKSHEILINADVKTIFGGPNVMDVKAQPSIDGTPQQAANSVKVADNYATMFSLAEVRSH